MIVAIVGGLNIDNEKLLNEVMEASTFPFDKILTTEDNGISRNVCALAAKKNIPYEIYYPDTYNLAPTEGKVEIRKNKQTGVMYNKRAPLNRNEKLFKDCNAIIVIWDGESSGCRTFVDMIKNDNTKLSYVVKVNPNT